MDTTSSNVIDSPEEIPRGAPTRTLEKGLFLLGLFDMDRPEWTLKELRERAGLPKATTRRLMKTLEASHWVAHDSVSGKYHLGSSVLRALYLATSHSELVRAAHPYLVKLEEETTESSSLSVWTDQGALILDTVPTARPFKPFTFVGMLLPGSASADAQVLIAFGSQQTQEAVLATPQERRTEHTVTDPEALRERWRQIRREGVGFDREEWRIGAPAVAAPVFDQNGELRATLSVVPPIERCSEAQMQIYAAAVKRTAAELSAELGCQGS
jgi:DNA-binding IclR family transcriptional regulator